MKSKPAIEFNIITLFPDAIAPYLISSVIGRAIKKGLLKINVHNLRDFTAGPHHKADDRPYGGGPGMVMKSEPLMKAIGKVVKSGRARGRVKIIILSPAGHGFNEKMAVKLAKNYDRIILVAGHYEGIDERVRKIFKPEMVSTGPYVLTGGELPALTVVDAVSRKVKGVLGHSESLEERRYGVGVPVYTRPEALVYLGKKYRVPKVLMSGDHKKIERWRLAHRGK
jgi:tRNA (guanine37-N1)-methyltransferase